MIGIYKSFVYICLKNICFMLKHVLRWVKFKIIFIVRDILRNLCDRSRINFIEATFTLLLKFYLKKISCIKVKFIKRLIHSQFFQQILKSKSNS